ncbi:cytochrome c oxidase assembly protein [Paenibacillus chartarius]|uniref:Cytochrome c oxidase assembly protein n=1 Tax=Paenibacillus chartarius TaxID=747481 RepID=A0ABV6DGD7_9BACL
MDWNLLEQMMSGSFVELWSPVTVLLLVVVGYAYLHAARTNGFDPRISIGQKTSFLFGLVLFYAAVGSPLDWLGHHYFFSIHMLNQSILYLIMPLFILHGMPGWMVERSMKALRLERLFKFLTRPLIAVFTFNMLFSLYHIPKVMDTVMNNDWLLFSYHTVLLIAAFAMWFPVVGNVQYWERMSELKRMGYIFLNGVLLTPACALILFAGKPLYEMYRDVVMPIAGYSIVDDQQLGGVIMKIIQEITYGAALAFTFFRWYRTERSKEDEDELAEQVGQQTSPNSVPKLNGV